MVRDINIHLYEGNGLSITQRNQVLPDYEVLVDIEDPRYYIAEKGLRDAVNVSLALGQPLLLTGEPGTGKTQLAASIAHELELPFLEFYTKTTSTATDLFYRYDAMQRFQDRYIKEGRKKPTEEYILYEALGKSILLAKSSDGVRQYLPDELHGKNPSRSVVLIDELDKAPRDLPNDVLNEIEKMEFTVKETGNTFKAEARFRPILILTSNSEKDLPDAFLRRCLFYHIVFPSENQLKEIVQRRFSEHPKFTPDFISGAIDHFFEIRDLSLKKKPATAEFLAWIRILESLDLDVKDIASFGSGQLEALALSYSILAKTQADLEHLKDKFT